MVKCKVSVQRVELATSEGRTRKNQFRMFTEPVETCLFYVSCIIILYVIFYVLEVNFFFFFLLFRKNKEGNDSQRFYRNGSSTVNIRGKALRGFNYVTLNTNQY